MTEPTKLPPDRAGSDATWDAPTSALPTDAPPGVALCHSCRTYRPAEFVRDNPEPTCTTCEPDHELDPRPLEALTEDDT